MKHAALLSALTLTALAGLTQVALAASQPVSDADKTFVASVSQGGMFEVKLGQLAEQQGHAQDIKDQGATEAHDHALVGDKLKATATAAGLSFPDTLNDTFQKQLDSIKALSGTAFDNAYLQAMEVIHAKDGAAFAKEAKSGTNPGLKSFAAETYRIVERHIGELKAVGPEK